MLKFLQQRKLEGNPVRFIRLDNSGENKSFQDKASTKGYADIKFEFTAPGTPQQNGVAERAFPALLGRVRAMMNQAGFSHELRGLLWAECVSTATVLENSMPDTVGDEPPIVKMYGSPYKWIEELRMFGEMAVLTNNASLGYGAKN
jgi:hypothetical protein